MTQPTTLLGRNAVFASQRPLWHVNNSFNDSSRGRSTPKTRHSLSFGPRPQRARTTIPRVWKGRENIFVCPQNDEDRRRAQETPFISTEMKATFFYKLGDIFSEEDLQTMKNVSIGLAIACLADPSINDNSDLSDNDRKTILVVANAVEIICGTETHGFELELTSERACTLFSVALVEALRSNGISSAELKLGYYVSYDAVKQAKESSFHSWVEVDGRVIDVANDTLALLETAKETGIADHTDVLQMEKEFDMKLFPYLKNGKLESGRGLVVLNEKVFVGYSPNYYVSFSPLTEVTPPAEIEGAVHATEVIQSWRHALNENKTITQLVDAFEINDTLEKVLTQISAITVQ